MGDDELADSTDDNRISSDHLISC